MTHDNPNYMISSNPSFIQYTIKWIDLLREHAEPIVEDLESDGYFRSLRNKLELAMTKAEGLINRDKEWL